MSVSALQYSKFLYMDTVGDGSGTIDQAVDGSLVQKRFRIKPPEGQIYNFTSAVLLAVATAGWNDATAYGPAGTLATGIEIKCINTAGVIADFTEAHKITDWAHWAMISGQPVIVSPGNGPDALTVLWDFTTPFELVGDQGDEIYLNVNDDLSGLVYQHASFETIITSSYITPA